MHSLPRSQGLVGGLIGLIVIELAVIAAVVAIVITYGGIQWEMLPMLALLVFGMGTGFRGLMTRIKTLRDVSSGLLAVVRVLSRTDAYLPLRGLEASEALERCRTILYDDTKYEQVSAEDGTLRALLKSRFTSPRVKLRITVDQGAQILHISFEFVAIDDRHEREIQRFVRSLYPNNR
jgi:hypothetical protein